MKERMNVNAPPKISVLMPVYNAAPYLREAVESILRQSFSDFEFLIVDDGSTDDSLRILQDYAARDSRIRLTSRANTGYVVALNEMLDQARGAFLARMDSDDIALPQRFERQLNYLEQDPECVAVGSAILLVDRDRLPICQVSRPLEHDAIDRELLSGIGGSLIHPAVMMRREAVERVGRYRNEYLYAEDLDLFLRLAEVGRLANLPEVLLEYRQHPSSVNATRHRQQHELVTEIVAEAHRRRGLALPEGWQAPSAAQADPLQQRRNWVWMALKSGHVRTARKYAARVFLAQPLSIDSWRLMCCALRGY